MGRCDAAHTCGPFLRQTTRKAPWCSPLLQRQGPLVHEPESRKVAARKAGLLNETRLPDPQPIVGESEITTDAFVFVAAANDTRTLRDKERDHSSNLCITSLRSVDRRDPSFDKPQTRGVRPEVQRRIPGGFNRSLQHRVVGPSVAARRTLRQVSSIRGSFGVGC